VQKWRQAEEHEIEPNRFKSIERPFERFQCVNEISSH